MSIAKVRYPAEWEKQSATWLAFPHNKTNWYGERGINIRKFYVELIRNITEFQPVNLLLPTKNFLTDEEKAALANRPFPVNFIVIKTNDIWIRDYGPFFLKRDCKRGNKKSLQRQSSTLGEQSSRHGDWTTPSPKK